MSSMPAASRAATAYQRVDIPAYHVGLLPSAGVERRDREIGELLLVDPKKRARARNDALIMSDEPW
jgi:hypothetical protein